MSWGIFINYSLTHQSAWGWVLEIQMHPTLRVIKPEEVNVHESVRVLVCVSTQIRSPEGAMPS